MDNELCKNYFLTLRMLVRQCPKTGETDNDRRRQDLDTCEISTFDLEVLFERTAFPHGTSDKLSFSPGMECLTVPRRDFQPDRHASRYLREMVIFSQTDIPHGTSEKLSFSTGMECVTVPWKKSPEQLDRLGCVPLYQEAVKNAKI